MITIELAKELTHYWINISFRNSNIRNLLISSSIANLLLSYLCFDDVTSHYTATIMRLRTVIETIAMITQPVQ